MTIVERPVGIDLGTTNSEVALLEPSERELWCYEDRFKRRTVPSAVAWDGARHQIIVGRAARARRGADPAPIESVKRKMGQAQTLACGPLALGPEQVSAHILGELRDRMQEYLGARARGPAEPRVVRAVVTVPAYFDAPQVEATRQAAELAGLDPIGILQEPTAAAIYHTWRRQLGDGHCLVYDFGGGTFDVSILRCLGGEYQVLAIDGDNYLGGDDLDRRYAEQLRQQLSARGYALALDVRADLGDRARFARLVHLAQEIKEALSTSETVHIAKQAVLVDQQGEPVDFEAEIGRADYEAVVADLVESTIERCERALSASRERASVGIGDIDRVILVGGSTRMPLVVRRVTEALCARARTRAPLQEEVDTCVALGAAIHAAQVGGLRIGDEHQRAQLLFTTSLVGAKSPLTIGVRVEQAPEEARELAVVRGAETLCAAPFGLGELAPVRLAVPLGAEEEQPLSAVLRDPEGAALATLPFALYRGDVKPRPSALSRPAVIAKDIAVEVVRGGRRERRVLLPRGTGLPMRAAHTFRTADQSGVVVLRLLQGQLPVKTLALAVPRDLAVGTAVELALVCDEAMRLQARASVAGEELSATVEPPRQATVERDDDIELLVERAESVRRGLWGRRAEAFRREVDPLLAAIREVASTDPDKLTVLCHRLRALLDELGPDESAGGLTPPLAHFEWELDALRRVVYRATSALMGMDRAAWDRRIAEIDARARQAYEAADAVAWRRVCDEVQALRETAHQDEFAAMRLDDPGYLARRIAAARYRASELEVALADLVLADAEPVRALQLAEQGRLLAALGAKVRDGLGRIDREPSDAVALRRRLERVETELERIETALGRVGSIGIVAEHAGGPERP